MKKILIILFLFLGSSMAQVTPNLSFNIPPYNFPNWNVPINQNFSQLDLMLSGNYTLPAFKVTTLLLPGTSNGCLNISGTVVGSQVCQSGLYITTVSGLSGTPGLTNGSLAVVTNGASNSDCTTGGGTTNVLCQYNGSTWSAPFVSSANGSLPAGQIGDIIRYNVSGDSNWDAVNAAQKQVMVYWDYGAGTLAVVGNTNSVNHLGSQNNINATSTDNWALSLASSASASTSTVIGVDQGTGGNYGSYSWAGFYRWTHRFAAQNTTNARYWMGLTQWLNSTTVVPLNTTAFATDTPNQPVVGFRYSAGTDTAWQAVVGTTSSLITVTATGVAIDTNIHVFEILPVISGTSLTGYKFYIDKNLVATISTNVPSITNQAPIIFWCGDNKNTATAITGNFYDMKMSLK